MDTQLSETVCFHHVAQSLRPIPLPQCALSNHCGRAAYPIRPWLRAASSTEEVILPTLQRASGCYLFTVDHHVQWDGCFSLGHVNSGPCILQFRLA
ncbi:hypothetical protein ABBQ38_003648 [Trebouxia sp. C0009 RCD-2024]